VVTYTTPNGAGWFPMGWQFDGALTDGPAWSPDGVWLAFSTDIGDGPDIWLAEAATGAVYQVTQNAYARCPIWVMGQK